MLNYSSSSSIYGRSSLPFKEGNPRLPISPYGVSKLAAEEYCRVFYEVYGLDTTCLRYFTVYGPRMRPDLAISIFVRNALDNKNLVVFGTGKSTRDFTYIDDIVGANMSAINKGKGEAFNIGTGASTSVLDLAKKIIEITGSRSKIEFSEGRKGDMEHTCADISRAKKILGWKPKVSLEEGLNKYIESVNQDS